MENCRENLNLVEIGQNYRRLHSKSKMYSVFSGDINSPKSLLCTTQHCLIVDNHMQLNNIHITDPFQQLLRELVTMRPYTYII
jgi:hypothetical protein